MADHATPETLNQELATLRAKPDFTARDAAQMTDVLHAADEQATGEPVRRRLELDAAIEQQEARARSLQAEITKRPEGHPDIPGLIDRRLAATRTALALKQQLELVDTETATRARDAAMDAAPLYLPPLDRWAGAWDETELRALRGTMHREGAGDKFQAVVTVIADLLNTKADGVPEHDLPARMREHWGSNFDRKRDARDLAWGLFAETMPKQAAQIESRRLDLHPRFVNVLAEVGLKLLDVSTTRGAARQTELTREKLAARRKAG